MITIAQPFILGAKDAAEEKKRTKDEETRLYGNEIVIESVQSRLASHIMRCWNAAKLAKEPINAELLENARQRKGEYSQDKLNDIRDFGGSEIFVKLTLEKCRVAESWLEGILKATEDMPFSIKPTPIAELPYEVQMEVIEEVQKRIMQSENILSMDEVNEISKEVEEKKKRRLQEKAKERCIRAQKKIHDIITEGGWLKALYEIKSDIVTYKAGILKGPVVRKEKRLKWSENEFGVTKPVVDDVYVFKFYRVSPFDLYPSPSSQNVNDGYLFERHRMTRRQLEELRNLRGYNKEKINELLRKGAQLSTWLYGEDEAMDAADIDIEYETSREGKIDVLEFWGDISGDLLIEWGMSTKQIKDPQKEYQVCIWLVGNEVIKSVINPDPLGRKPYHMTSFEKIPGSFWGKGIPDIMDDVQDAVNATMRSAINNMAMASGPFIGIDNAMVEQGDDTDEIYPWKKFNFDSSVNMSMGQQVNKLPIEFFQINPMVEKCIAMLEYLNRIADEHTGIPAYTYGKADIGGAARTASGLSMLITSAGKVIRSVASQVDSEIIASSIEMLYIIIMLYDNDESIKGDVNVVARGSNSLIAKENTQLRIMEFLNFTNNPTDIQIVGISGRAYLIKEVARLLDLNHEEIVQDPEKLKELERQIMEMQKQQVQIPETANIPGQLPNPTETNMAGDKLSGGEGAIFLQGRNK